MNGFIRTIPFRKSRRDFLKVSTAAGGGLALQLVIPAGALAAAAGPKGPQLTAWIGIGADDSVLVRGARSEMGQGSATRLPMLVAGELQCAWKKVGTKVGHTR